MHLQIMDAYAIVGLQLPQIVPPACTGISQARQQYVTLGEFID
jgi:hypothetical protein